MGFVRERGAPLTMGYGYGGCKQVEQPLVNQHVLIARVINSWNKCNGN